MMDADKAWFDTEITRLGLIEAFCDKHGEVDGATAARAQRRALEAELAAREKAGS